MKSATQGTMIRELKLVTKKIEEIASASPRKEAGKKIKKIEEIASASPRK